MHEQLSSSRTNCYPRAWLDPPRKARTRDGRDPECEGPNLTEAECDAIIAATEKDEVTVYLPSTEAFQEVLRWTEEQAPHRRGPHPLYDRLLGRPDSEGDWAWRTLGLGYYAFWFRDHRLAVLFALRWKGQWDESSS